MREIYKCEYCGDIFDNKEDCIKHEIEKHGGLERYYKIIHETLSNLNDKYNTNRQVENCNINVLINECDGYEYEDFEVSIQLDDYLINICESETYIIDKIKNDMEQVFLDNINVIEGTLKYEGWCGGYGSDDFIINDVYLKSFLLNKQDKRVRIEILD